MSKNSIKSIEDLVYKIKKGENVQDGSKLSQTKKDERFDGPAKHSYPRKKPTERLIEYEKLSIPPQRPNKIKLGIGEGESRFPTESKVPNYKKYDENGNYIKHKLPNRKDETDKTSDVSVSNIARKSLSSNQSTRRGKKG